MLTITIMQGAPGFGKNYHGEKIAAELGADLHDSDSFPNLYGTGENGEITFNMALLGSAHGACFLGAIESLQAGRSVVIANTNTTTLECAPYLQLAQAFGAEPKIVQIKCDPSKAHARNTHGVPYAVAKVEGEEGVRRYATEAEFRAEKDRVTVVGGFVAMVERLSQFAPEFHWQFIPGFEISEIEN